MSRFYGDITGTRDNVTKTGNKTPINLKNRNNTNPRIKNLYITKLEKFIL